MQKEYSIGMLQGCKLSGLVCHRGTEAQYSLVKLYYYSPPLRGGDNFTHSPLNYINDIM